MMVLGTHILDMMRFLAGDPEWVFGHVTRSGRPITREDASEPTEPIGPVAGDAVYAMYRFPGGVRGFFTSVRGQHVHGPRTGITMVGTKGALSIRYSNGPCLRLCKGRFLPEEGGEFQVVQAGQEPEVPGAEPLDKPSFIARGNRRAVWDIRVAAAEGREPVSSGKDALYALEMILGVYASHLAGKPLLFPLEERRHPLIH